MWRQIIVLVLCFQFFVRNFSEAQVIGEESSAKVKSKFMKGSGVSPKKAKLENVRILDEHVTETTTTDFDISLPPEFANDTIKRDHHRYYNSTFYGSSEAAKNLWINIDELPDEHVITNKMLSNSHRQATTIELSFDFPFYGSLLRNITLATGGFLYMGDYMHNWIAATQYVAPLMANFDTTISDNSTVKYADNGTFFTVQWENVFIKDKAEDGAFTFQATLYENGDICFAYKQIPFPIDKISDESHPVKIGISDAYILERNVFFIRRKTIYEYHRADMLKYPISNNTAIYFTALTTCLNYKDCQSCMAADKSLECSWCDPVQRCSDGIDRQRQSWIVNGCAIRSNSCSEHKTDHTEGPGTKLPKGDDIGTIPQSKDSSSKFNEPSEMPSHVSDPNEVHLGPMSESKDQDKDFESVAPYVQDEYPVKDSGSMTTGAIIAIIVFVIALIGVGSWIFYAYRFPQSSSGQFLIKYRPSQWNLKLEDHSITADSFHM